MKEVEDTWIDPGTLVGLEKGEVRGAGHTTHQMKTAPEGSVFVWCNGNLTYPKQLARDLGREDLIVVPSTWFITGYPLPQLQRERKGVQHVVVDHAYYEMNENFGLMAQAIR